MRKRSHRGIYVILGFLLLVGAASFAAFGFRGEEVAAFLPAPYLLTEPVVVHAKTTDGTTTYWGKFPNLSQCGTISTGIAALESQDPRITLLFTVLEPANGCEVPGTASQDFSASYIPLNKDLAPVFEGVTINGVIAKYTLVEEDADQEAQPDAADALEAQEQ